MPSYSRPSPNAVIHDWLSHTDVGHKAEWHASSSKKKRTSRVKHHQHRLRVVDDHVLPRGSVRQGIESVDGDRALKEPESLHSPASLENCTRHLAQRLGLRTPFRALDRNQKQLLAKEDDAIPQAKRKRSLSPSSPSLRSRDKRRSLVEADDREHLIRPRLTGHAAGSDKNIVKSLFRQPASSTTVLNSFKTVAKPYERKSRRKTRENRYSLKESSKVSDQINNEGESPVRKKGKRKRREKSGSALMHDFTARNIAFSRLTLRSAPAVGIFSKGRASSPIKRMGLLDLAFSEVSFLKSRKEKPEGIYEPLERSLGRRNGGFARDDAVISRYFTLTKDSTSHRLGPELKTSASSEQRRCGRDGFQVPKEKCSINGKALLPLLELPEKPFLGFGSSGFSMSSPAKLHTPLRTPRRAAHSSAHLTSPTRSTTYYTWSRSGALSQGSLSLRSGSKILPRSGLNDESRPHRALAGHTKLARHQDMQVEHPSGHDDVQRQSEATASGAEDQAQILEAGCDPGQAQQPTSMHTGSKEPLIENGRDDDDISLGNVRNQDYSANGSMETSLAEKTLVASLDIPLVSGHSDLKNNFSFKPFDAALDRLIRPGTETPSWRITNTRYENAVHSDTESKEPKVQVARQDTMPRFEIQDSSVLATNPTSVHSPFFPPLVSTTQPPQILSQQGGRSLGRSLSTAWLSRGPRPHERAAHRVPVSNVPVARTCVIRPCDTPSTNAWHGYDNIYERQEMHRYNLSSGSVGNMRGYTPAETLSTEESIALEGHFTHPYHGLDSRKCAEKVGFQQPEEHIWGSSNPLNEYSENVPRATYQNIDSPVSHDLVANVGEDDRDPHVNEEYSHDERIDVAENARLDLGQTCPLQNRFNVFRRPRDLARQDYPLFEPYVEDNPLLRSQASPSHAVPSRDGFMGSSDRIRLDQDEEGHLAGFWKPNLLY